MNSRTCLLVVSQPHPMHAERLLTVTMQAPKGLRPEEYFAYCEAELVYFVRDKADVTVVLTANSSYTIRLKDGFPFAYNRESLKPASLADLT